MTATKIINFYVAESSEESNNYRVQKFDSNGTFITKWGSEGSGNGQFDGPESIAIDSFDKVYVAELYSDRIQVFAPKA
ncbi:MAG: hypothetical protein WBL67_15610 [Nitrososphaeraceae archaeon]